MHILTSFIKDDTTVAGRLLLPLAKYGNAHLIRAIILSRTFINAAYTCPLEQQKELLKRLILTGNKDNLALYLEHSLIHPSAIDNDIVSYAKQRAEISQGTYVIYNRLCDVQKKHAGKRKRKHQDIEISETTQCSICLEDVTSDKRACERDHAMHIECFKDMFKKGLPECPVCKGVFELTYEESTKMRKYIKKREYETIEEDRLELLNMLTEEERAYQEAMFGSSRESRLVSYHSSDSEDIDLDYGS